LQLLLEPMVKLGMQTATLGFCSSSTNSKLKS